VLPAREDSAYGLAWMLLHFIETSPSWPIWAALDDRSPWVVFLHAVGRSHRASCGSSSINHHRYHGDVTEPDVEQVDAQHHRRVESELVDVNIPYFSAERFRQ
jgi:hypothetical protein